MRKTNFAVLLMLLGLLVVAVPALHTSAQDVDGAEEQTRDDGFDWGWLGLLGLLGLLPRKPVDEHVDDVRISDSSRSPR